MLSKPAATCCWHVIALPKLPAAAVLSCWNVKPALWPGGVKSCKNNYARYTTTASSPGNTADSAAAAPGNNVGV